MQQIQTQFIITTCYIMLLTALPALQLIMNVDCTDTAECARAGATLVNTTSQTRLTDGLAKGGVSLLPGTFQVGCCVWVHRLSCTSS